MDSQLNLFSNSVKVEPEKTINLFGISGLEYYAEFLTREEEILLKDAIDSEIWLDDLKRRVQHYGFKYDYKKRAINESMRVAPLPKWSIFISERLQEKNFIDFVPDQMIINEYFPGQGIADHIDCEPCFQSYIISISLLSPVNMMFTEKANRKNKLSKLLEPRSAIVLKDNARYNWLHGIKPSKRYKDNSGVWQDRTRRISLTFRKVILG